MMHYGFPSISPWKCPLRRGFHGFSRNGFAARFRILHICNPVCRGFGAFGLEQSCGSLDQNFSNWVPRVPSPFNCSTVQLFNWLITAWVAPKCQGVVRHRDQREPHLFVTSGFCSAAACFPVHLCTSWCFAASPLPLWQCRVGGVGAGPTSNRQPVNWNLCCRISPFFACFMSILFLSQPLGVSLIYVPLHCLEVSEALVARPFAAAGSVEEYGHESPTSAPSASMLRAC